MRSGFVVSVYSLGEYIFSLFEARKTKRRSQGGGFFPSAWNSQTPAQRLAALNEELRELQIKRRGGVYVPPAEARPLPLDLSRIIMEFTSDDVARLELAAYLEEWLAEHEAHGGDLARLGPTDVRLIIEALFYRCLKKP